MLIIIIKAIIREIIQPAWQVQVRSWSEVDKRCWTWSPHSVTVLHSGFHHLDSISIEWRCLISRWYLRPDLVESQDGLNALVQEVCLQLQTAAVQGHQLLIEVHGEHVEVDAALRALGLPQGHRAQRASLVWRRRRRRRCQNSVRSKHGLLSRSCILTHLVCNCQRFPAGRGQGRRWVWAPGSPGRTDPRRRGTARTPGTVGPHAAAEPPANTQHRQQGGSQSQSHKGH